MPAALPASQTLAYLVPREDLGSLTRRLPRAWRALPVNGRTVVVAHDTSPEEDLRKELDLVIGPADADGPFERVQLHSIGIVELSSTAFLSWVRLMPSVPVVPALDPEPWDGDNPLAGALAQLPARLEQEGPDGFWRAAAELGLTEDETVDLPRLRRWGAAATADLAVTVRPVVVTVAAPTGWRWRFWPPSFW